MTTLTMRFFSLMLNAGLLVLNLLYVLFTSLRVAKSFSICYNNLCALMAWLYFGVSAIHVYDQVNAAIENGQMLFRETVSLYADCNNVRST